MLSQTFVRFFCRAVGTSENPWGSDLLEVDVHDQVFSNVSIKLNITIFRQYLTTGSTIHKDGLEEYVNLF